jgi:hypothetical protein
MYGHEPQMNKRCYLYWMVQFILALVPIIPFEEFSKKRINPNRKWRDEFTT